jgi:hypothetical protein
MSSKLRSYRLRLSALLHWRRQQREYAEELAFHQHMLRRRAGARGYSRAGARLGHPARLR